MAFTLNDVTLGAMKGLATVSLHETVQGKNRAVHVVVPVPHPSRLTSAMLKKQARAAAKDALQKAAAAL
jgi:hypothetical protein